METIEDAWYDTIKLGFGLLGRVRAILFGAMFEDNRMAAICESSLVDYRYIPRSIETDLCGCELRKAKNS